MQIHTQFVCFGPLFTVISLPRHSRRSRPPRPLSLLLPPNLFFFLSLPPFLSRRPASSCLLPLTYSQILTAGIEPPPRLDSPDFVPNLITSTLAPSIQLTALFPLSPFKSTQPFLPCYPKPALFIFKFHPFPPLQSLLLNFLLILTLSSFFPNIPSLSSDISLFLCLSLSF